MSISLKVPSQRALGPGGPEPRILGRSFPHDDAAAHVRGTAAFIDDLREPFGTVHVVPGCADAVRGRIQAIDLDAVRRAPDVVAVLTAKDVPAVNDCSPEQGDHPVLAGERILYHGQPVFAVVALTREAARRAARLARITLDEEAAVVTLAEAAGIAGREIAPPLRLRKGANPDPALGLAALQLEGTLVVEGAEHLYLETQTALAVPDGEGGMRILSSTQHSSHVGRVIARMLGIAEAQVVCECRRAGGGFGGKQTQAAQWAALAAPAAHVTGRPAKCRLGRSDDLVMTGKGHAARLAWRVGADKGGRILAVDVAMEMACGAAVDLSERVGEGALFHVDNAYFYPELRFQLRRFRTDHAPATGWRGTGAPHGMLVAEQIMDAVALSLRLDPLDVRKRNIYRVGRDVTPYGLPVSDNVGLALIEELERTADYRARRKAIAQHNYESEFLKKGIALTPVKFGAGFTDGQVQPCRSLPGRPRRRLGRAQAWRQRAGAGAQRQARPAPRRGVRARPRPHHRQACKLGNPARRRPDRFCHDPRAQWHGGEARGRDREETPARPRRGGFGHRPAPASFRRGCRHGRRPALELRRAGGERAERPGAADRPGTLCPAQGQLGPPARPGAALSLDFVFGAACSEVTIDTLTGELRLDRVDILQDCGISLNPAIDHGQIEGGFIQGLGWLVMEEIVRDAAGRLLTNSLATYNSARHQPAGRFRVQLFTARPGRDTAGLGAKAVGEPPLMLAISVYSAITQAIAALRPGAVPALDVPATPERSCGRFAASAPAREREPWQAARHGRFGCSAPVRSAPPSCRPCLTSISR